jgi:hypothetical protein
MGRRIAAFFRPGANPSACMANSFWREPSYNLCLNSLIVEVAAIISKMALPPGSE